MRVSADIHLPPHASPAGDDPLGLTAGELVARRVREGAGPGQALTAYRRLFREGVTDHSLATTRTAPIVRVLRSESPEGEVYKFVQRLDPPSRGPLARDERVEHLDIESVVIPMVGRRGYRTHTLCVSSQVGCAMGCDFCETAQMGLVRSLTAAEIVGQWHAATHALNSHPDVNADPSDREARRITNIVFMGMGEPMDNAAEVIRAIAVLTDHNGAGLAASKITVSTVGRIDGLEKLADVANTSNWRRLGLAVSLNAPNDTVRSSIMPINKGMPMADLREALARFPRLAQSKLCVEYVLIPGVNDQPDHAAELAEYLRPLGALIDPTRGAPPSAVVNVIPYNPRRDSPWPAPAEERVADFIAELADQGLFVKRRRTKGRDTMAACGQLGAASIRKRKYVGVTLAGETADPDPR
ncbi:MAG: 23S rRNA (adenine(2503)-C(2))-methyltransferase RlmN [Planctomycetota bacterium]